LVAAEIDHALSRVRKSDLTVPVTGAEMDEPSVASWIERYVGAWETNDSAEIGDLFAEHGRYYPRPDGEPWRGRAGIIDNWLARKDEPGTWAFRNQILALAGDLAFVRGWTHYTDPATDYSNLWVIRFDADGRCLEFTEWWMEREQGDTAANPGGSDERGGA
jgi:SnoaL-like domain